MTDKIEYAHGDYECLVYNSKPECKICDGFGRNLNNLAKIEECYITKIKMRTDLSLDKKIIA
jgi:hypothetical protein